MMKRFIFPAACVFFSASAMAQQADETPMMQQMMQLLQSPQAQQAIGQVMGNQEIDLAQQGFDTSQCDESKLRDCRAGYHCEGHDGQGRSSVATIQGRNGARCHVTLKNSDGSNGDCNYTKLTINNMLRLNGRKKVKMQDAMALGARVMSECKFTDVNGKPVRYALPAAGQQPLKGGMQ